MRETTSGLYSIFQNNFGAFISVNIYIYTVKDLVSGTFYIEKFAVVTY